MFSYMVSWEYLQLVLVAALLVATIVLGVLLLCLALSSRKNLERAMIVVALAMCFLLPALLKIPEKPRAELYPYYLAVVSQQLSDPRQPGLSEVLRYSSLSQPPVDSQPFVGVGEAGQMSNVQQQLATPWQRPTGKNSVVTREFPGMSSQFPADAGINAPVIRELPRMSSQFPPDAGITPMFSNPFLY